MIIIFLCCLLLATVELLGNQESGNNETAKEGIFKLTKTECGNNVTAEGDIFKYDVDKSDMFSGVSVIKFLNPLTPECNYFEYEIIAEGEEGAIGIGVGEREYPLSQMPGWCENGVGYHADDGCIFNEGECDFSFRQTCKKSDKMGCGVEFDEKDTEFVNIFFTKNGQQVGDTIKLKKPANGLYSCIGMYSKGEQVRYLGHSKRNLPINLLKVRHA